MKVELFICLAEVTLIFINFWPKMIVAQSETASQFDNFQLYEPFLNKVSSNTHGSALLDGHFPLWKFISFSCYWLSLQNSKFAQINVNAIKINFRKSCFIRGSSIKYKNKQTSNLYIQLYMFPKCNSSTFRNWSILVIITLFDQLK